MTGNTFSKETRVRLVLLLNEVFSPAEHHWMADGFVGGYEQGQLEYLLKKKLGTFEIGKGGKTADRLTAFFTTASDEHLLDAIELLPEAQWEGGKSTPTIPPFTDRDLATRVNRLVERMNEFLEREGLLARFDTWTLLRTGVVDTVPKTIGALPKQEEFKEDVARRLIDKSEPTAFIFIDLDNFKAVNDSISHQAGDQCLAAVVDAIGSALRGKGRLYRYGGDEFAVVLPNFVVEEAAATAERIRAAIDFANPGATVKVTASIGVIASDQDYSSHGTLLEVIDECTYVSKDAGKNRVTVWPVDGAVLATVRENRARGGSRR